MKAKFDREMGDYVKEQNKKYKTLLTDKCEVEDKRDDLAKQLKALQQKLSEQESKYQNQLKGQLMSQDQALRDMQKDFEKKMADLKADLADKDRQVKSLRDQLDQEAGSGRNQG